MNIAWSFSFLTGFVIFRLDLINKMGESGIIKKFVQLMDCKYEQLRHPIINLIGNVLTGSDEHTRKCLQLGILNKYYKMLNMSSINNKEQKLICWSISNVCATNNPKDKLEVMKHGLFKILISDNVWSWL